MDLSQWKWTCACCGQRKRGVPDFGYDAPIHHAWAEEGDPDFKVLNKTDDLCRMEIGGQECWFIRSVLCLPITGTEARMGFGVWSTLSEANYARYTDTFDGEDQSRLGPSFGYLANRLPCYPDTLNLKLDVLPRNGRLRPLLFLRDEHRAPALQGSDRGDRHRPADRSPQPDLALRRARLRWTGRTSSATPCAASPRPARS